jgi:hypothetical protein
MDFLLPNSRDKALKSCCVVITSEQEIYRPAQQKSTRFGSYEGDCKKRTSGIQSAYEAEGFVFALSKVLLIKVAKLKALSILGLTHFNHHQFDIKGKSHISATFCKIYVLFAHSDIGNKTHTQPNV